jgi:hypothetical protein
MVHESRKATAIARTKLLNMVIRLCFRRKGIKRFQKFENIAFPSFTFELENIVGKKKDQAAGAPFHNPNGLQAGMLITKKLLTIPILNIRGRS